MVKRRRIYIDTRDSFLSQMQSKQNTNYIKCLNKNYQHEMLRGGKHFKTLRLHFNFYLFSIKIQIKIILITKLSLLIISMALVEGF